LSLDITVSRQSSFVVSIQLLSKEATGCDCRCQQNEEKDMRVDIGH